MTQLQQHQLQQIQQHHQLQLQQQQQLLQLQQSYNNSTPYVGVVKTKDRFSASTITSVASTAIVSNECLYTGT